MDSHAITFPDLPPVLATPYLVWMLEETCMELLQTVLQEDEMTLGTQVDVEHLGMARIGDEVTFVATVIQAEGRDFLFRVEAHHEGNLISKGLHRRKLVSTSRLQKKLNR